MSKITLTVKGDVRIVGNAGLLLMGVAHDCLVGQLKELVLAKAEIFHKGTALPDFDLYGEHDDGKHYLLEPEWALDSAELLPFVTSERKRKHIQVQLVGACHDPPSPPRWDGCTRADAASAVRVRHGR